MPEEAKNPKREPSSIPNPIATLFQDKSLILGDQHVKVPDGQGGACGPNCPHRLTSITCPYFSGVPCLVGCNIKQVLSGSDTGAPHEEIDIFVTSQAGYFLVGDENIIDLRNPRASHLRILTNKHGRQLGVTGAIPMSLFAMKTGVKISEEQVSGNDE